MEEKEYFLINLDEIKQHGVNSALFLAYIRNESSKRGSKWVEASQADIATVLGMTRYQIRDVVKKLVDTGAIEKKQEKLAQMSRIFSYKIK